MSAQSEAYRGKRTLDLVLATVLGPAAALICAICAVIIRATSGGPALFRHERVGMKGVHFHVLKLRTMTDEDNPIFPDASRITPVGRVLRRFSLDELPQILNVVRGEMSMVGPRPAMAYQVERYNEQQRRRLSVRPGLTGLAQLRGRNSTSWAVRIQDDLEYVETQSLLLDLRIVVATLGAVLRGRGVEGHPVDDAIARVEP